MNNKEIFLKTAIKIGERLVRNAVWDGSKCTWYIMEPDGENRKNRVAKKTIASGRVYQGTAGILLFLSALYEISPNVNLKKAIKGTVNYSISEGNKLANNSFGLHSGRVGIAFAIVKAAKALNEESYFIEAIKVLEPLKGNEASDEGIDVIGGAAGAIPALLQMEQIFKNNLCFNMAIALGENLISNAHMETTGWSWGFESKTNYRNLLGYAHGASGIAHAFLELYNITNSSYFLYAAEQAFLYERQFYDGNTFNWPDFRHAEIGEYIYNGEIDKLKTKLINKTLSPYIPQYMNAWCHGAPGIGLSRIRAYQLTEDAVYLKEAKNAMKGTSLSLTNNTGANFSLCHGIGGNCEALIYGSKVINSSQYYEIAEQFGLMGYEKFEKLEQPWPCGTQQAVSDNSLMLGEAGIGYFYLRLYSKDVPSILFLTTEYKNPKAYSKDFKILQSNYINNYFGNIINSIEKLSASITEKINEFELGKTVSDVTKTYNLINEFVNSSTNKQEIKTLENLFKLEKRKYELSVGLTEYHKEFTNEIMKEEFNKVDWNNSLVKLSSETKLIETVFETGMPPDLQINEDKNYIVYRSQNKIITKELEPFAFAILELIGKGNKIKNVIKGIFKLFESDEADIKEIEQTVLQQLKEMYRASFITIDRN